MALRLLLHSVSAYALGYPMDGSDTLSGSSTARYPKEGRHGHGSGRGKSLKDSNEGNAMMPQKESSSGGFQMPLRYPRYKKADYDNMEEWQLEKLLTDYGVISFKGTLEEKRAFVKGAFLWPDQL